MRRGPLAALAILACGAPALAAVDTNAKATSTPQIVLPRDGDDYSALVARAAAQDQSVDFKALRFAYLKSKARKAAGADADALRQTLFSAVEAGDHGRVREAAIKLLSADYIDMWGHKYLHEACFMLHDEACDKQGKFVEFGLLRSILATGTGKECTAGFEVVSVAEEYFMLSMVDAKDIRQSLISGTPSCDLMEFTDQDGKPKSYYFRIDAVLADEAEGLGIK
ncbi:MAG: DUF4919 domain-containing protein [Alphaproteobacteria bacterium]|nr:DUF4919 domain-containing protein [Alphaproteobacteria bacterium]